MPTGEYERKPWMRTGKYERHPQSGCTINEYKRSMVEDQKCYALMKVISINLPVNITKKVDEIVGRLHPSRSAAIRGYVMAGLQKDLEFIALIDGIFELGREYYPENKNEFTDQWGKTWNVGRAAENA